MLAKKTKNAAQFGMTAEVKKNSNNISGYAHFCV